MRIVSQNEMCDLNYDILELQVKKYTEKEYCIVHSSYNWQASIKFGIYSSKEKALKVMEMIREAYQLYINTIDYNNYIGRMGLPQNRDTVYCYFDMPQDNEV